MDSIGSFEASRAEGREEGLTFDPDAHIYRWNGRTVRSVTQIIKAAGLIDDTWFTDFARERGKAVHKAIFLDIMGDLHVDSLHPVVKPYVEGWLEFKAFARIKPLPEYCEWRGYNPVYNYAGTMDVFCLFNGRYSIIENKTGDENYSQYQTAGYANIPEIAAFAPDRFLLRLKNKGMPNLKPFRDPTDFDRFIYYIQKTREEACDLSTLISNTSDAEELMELSF